MSDSINQKLQELAQYTNVAGKGVQNALDSATQQAHIEADEKFNRNAVTNERVNNWIKTALGWLAVAFVGLFMVVGVFLAIVGFPVAEYLAIREGMLSLESNEFIASVTSFVVVIGLITLLFLRNMLRDNLDGSHGLKLTAGRTFINVLWFTGIAHIYNLATRLFGFNSRITPVNMSSDNELFVAVNSGLFLVQGSIFLLGFIGRMATTLDDDSTNLISWFQGVLTGNPLELIGTVGFMILTLALLAITDAIVLFIYSVFVYVAGRLNVGGADETEIANFINTRSISLQEALLDRLIIEAKAKQDRKRTQQLQAVNVQTNSDD